MSAVSVFYGKEIVRDWTKLSRSYQIHKLSYHFLYQNIVCIFYFICSMSKKERKKKNEINNFKQSLQVFCNRSLILPFSLLSSHSNYQAADSIAALVIAILTITTMFPLCVCSASILLQVSYIDRICHIIISFS